MIHWSISLSKNLYKNRRAGIRLQDIIKKKLEFYLSVFFQTNLNTKGCRKNEGPIFSGFIYWDDSNKPHYDLVFINIYKDWYLMLIPPDRNPVLIPTLIWSTSTIFHPGSDRVGIVLKVLTRFEKTQDRYKDFSNISIDKIQQ